MRVRFLLLALLVLALPTSPMAQDGRPGTPLQIRVEGGVGYGGAGAGPNTEAGGHLSGRTALQFRRGSVAYTFRMTATTGGASRYSRFALVGPSTIYDGFNDAALLIGYVIPLGERVEVVGSTGAAVVWGSRAVSNGCFSFCLSSGVSEPFTSQLGLPVELGLSTRVNDATRLGLTGYANANREETFGGVTLSVSVQLR